jgi:hypothetical protein
MPRAGAAQLDKQRCAIGPMSSVMPAAERRRAAAPGCAEVVEATSQRYLEPIAG